MNAWRRPGTVRGLLLAGVASFGLAASGCESSSKVGDAHSNAVGKGGPVSRLPEGRSERQLPLPEPEILPETHFSAGRVHEMNGRLARAAEQYRLAIGAKPDHVEAYNRLGIVLDQLRQFQEADQAFARAIALAPDQAHLHNNLAFSLVMQQRWQDAEVELARALELRPEFTRARVNLALVYAQQDRFDEALTQFQMAVPRADAYFNMGLMYQSRGRPAEAAVAFKTALALNPELVAARKRLEQLPAELVSAAEADAAALASPAPRTPTLSRREPIMGHRPSTQPTGSVPDTEWESAESEWTPEWAATTQPANGQDEDQGCGAVDQMEAGPTVSQTSESPVRSSRPSTQPARSVGPDATAEPPLMPRTLTLEIETSLDNLDWDAEEPPLFLSDLAEALEDYGI